MIGIGAVVVALFGMYFWYNGASAEPRAKTMTAAMTTGSVHVQKHWSLPEELLEVSAITWAGDDRIACIEDNDGVIYFFDVAAGRVTDQLRFTGKGDFEGLTLAGSVYYALRSDGTLFEVKPGGNEPSVKTFEGPFSSRNDCESLAYDAANNRLLVGVKEQDLTDPQRKGVYAFDLKSKTFDSKAVYYISGATEGKKKGKGTVRPSDIVLAPGGEGLYVLDGPRSLLLRTDNDGAVTQSIQLDKSLFPQPEGLCFAPNGDLYLSSEGTKKHPGTLARVQLQ